MEKRQKTLMIVLALVLAYAAYDFLLGGDTSAPGTPPPGFETGSSVTSSSTTSSTALSANRTQGLIAQAGQGLSTFQPPPDLELRDDPFSRPPTLKPVMDTPVQSSQLTGLTFQGTIGTRALINDRPYQVNDIIMGLTIIEFTSERIILSDNEGKRHVLRKN